MLTRVTHTDMIFADSGTVTVSGVHSAQRIEATNATIVKISCCDSLRELIAPRATKLVLDTCQARTTIKAPLARRLVVKLCSTHSSRNENVTLDIEGKASFDLAKQRSEGKDETQSLHTACDLLIQLKLQALENLFKSVSQT